MAAESGPHCRLLPLNLRVTFTDNFLLRFVHCREFLLTRIRHKVVCQVAILGLDVIKMNIGSHEVVGGMNVAKICFVVVVHNL